MVELEIWYDQQPENDFAEGDPAIVVSTAAALDQLLDRVLNETRDNRLGQMIQVGIKGRTGYPVLEVGLGEAVGFIIYHDEPGGSTSGSGSPDEFVEYVYQGNLSEVPADAEVPIATVRRGLHEFLTNGKQPSVVQTTVE
ncbi:Imm1 family immunity protein [Amycolatopsis sp. NPDC051372]|uniref:Imm1 family immunity protein n=1 Tax=Amycolatopsis sp. NPDC051372 TaxID=3155669 RepID=UPI0034221FAB